MGEIVLSTSSARLGAMPPAPIRQVRIPNRQVRGNDYKAEKIASGQAIAKGVQDLARAGMNIALSLERDRRVAEDSEVEAAYEKHLRESFMGVDGKEGVIARVAGAQKMADLDQFVKEGGELLTEKAAKEFLADRNYSRQNRDMMLQRFARISRPYQMHLQSGILNKSKEIKIAGLDNNFNQKLESWRAIGGDAGEVLDAFAQSQEERGTPEEKVFEDTRKIAQSMAADLAKAQYESITTEKGIDTAIKTLEEDPHDILEANESLAKQLEGFEPFSLETKKGLKHILEVRRGEIQDQKKVDVEKIASPGFESANTIWDPEDPTKPNVNRLAGVEEAISGLDKILSLKDDQGDLIYADGSTPRNIALERRNKLNEFADNIAAEEMMTKLFSMEREDPKSHPMVYDLKSDKLAKNILPGSREARLAKSVQDAFERKVNPIRSKQEKLDQKNNHTFLSIRKFELAGNRAQYKKEIFDAAMNDNITFQQWQALSKEFDNFWTKGDGAHASQKEQYAISAMSEIQKAFGVELGRLTKFDYSSGQLKYATGVKKDVEGQDNDIGYPGFTDRLLRLAEAATKLGLYDGMQIDFDPITGKKHLDYFGHVIDPKAKFDATNYFRQYVEKMKEEDYVYRSEEYIENLINAANRLEVRDSNQQSNDTKALWNHLSPEKRNEALYGEEE